DVLPGLHRAALPGGVADHGARTAGDIGHHRGRLAPGAEHRLADLGGDVVLGHAGDTGLQARAHADLGGAGRLAHDLDLEGRLAHAPLLHDAEAVQQAALGEGGVDVVLVVGGEVVAV